MREVIKLGGYLLPSWEQGMIVEIMRGQAKVLPINNAGQVVGKCSYMAPQTRRPIMVSVDGLDFWDRLGTLEPGNIQIGTWVIFVRRYDKPEVVFGWCRKEDYSKALNLFDERFGPRALTWKIRNENPPKGVCVPDVLMQVKPQETSLVTTKSGDIGNIGDVPCVQTELDKVKPPAPAVPVDRRTGKPMSRYAQKRRTRKQEEVGGLMVVAAAH